MNIIEVAKNSPAGKAGIVAGDRLIAVDGKPIGDVLDYQFATYEPILTLTVGREDGTQRTVTLRHPVGSPLGMTFESYLMDEQRTCRNKCVFCFIDQMPKGCRDSLYVKDDDARLSFLLGNYITLTNMSEQDIERVIRMRISPIGISVHTTDPELRVRMLKNPKASECYAVMKRFSEADIIMNAQIVLCPGWNDGIHLEKTLRDLDALRPSLSSVSVVPVGLTSHRDGLEPLLPVTREIAREVLEITKNFDRVYCSDEIYLLADISIPDADFFEEFPQLENGVGMTALFKEQWPGKIKNYTHQSIATGTAAAPFLRSLLGGLPVEIYPVENNFFGTQVTVAGLVTGGDIIAQLKGKPLGSRLLIPRTMLRHQTELFLDNMTVDEVSRELGVPVLPVDVDGECLHDELER